MRYHCFHIQYEFPCPLLVSLFAGGRDAAVRGSVAYVEQSTVTLITSKRCEQPCVR